MPAEPGSRRFAPPLPLWAKVLLIATTAHLVLVNVALEALVSHIGYPEWGMKLHAVLGWPVGHLRHIGLHLPWRAYAAVTSLLWGAGLTLGYMLLPALQEIMREGQMNHTTASARPSQPYQLIQRLFILGCVLNILLTFVPSAIVTTPGFFTHEEQLMSNFDAIRLAAQRGQGALGVLFVLIFAAYIAFAVLAIVQQKRWVFITGASVAAFIVLLDLFSPGNPNVEYLVKPRLIGYVATLFMLSGYLAKPPTRTTTTTTDSPEPRNQRDCPHCAERILAKAKICKHCGREVTSTA